MNENKCLTDEDRFSKTCFNVIERGIVSSGIGTLKEKTLHAVLKEYYRRDGMETEVRIGKYVADIADEREIIEIQTGSFTPLRPKLEEFLQEYKVTVVYPVPKNKWICWIDPETGETSKQHKSPRKGTCANAFPELCKIKTFLNHPNFNLLITMIDLLEYRYLNGWSRDRKRGSVRCDRVPKNIAEEIIFSSADDYKNLIPQSLPKQFTSKDFAAAAHIKYGSRKLSAALSVLKETGALWHIGNEGRMYLYEQVE